MTLQFALYSAPAGTLIADYSGRIESPILATNIHGFAEAGGFVPMSMQEAFRLYDRTGLPHVVFSDSAAGTVYEGRLEDVNIAPGGVELRAFGYSRALSDVPYTALWSSTNVRDWKIMTASESGHSNRVSERYTIDFNNRIQIALQKNTVYGTGTDVGEVYLVVPHLSSRDIIGFSCDWLGTLPSNFLVQLQTFAEDWTFIEAFTIHTGSGGTVPGAYFRAALTSGARRIAISVHNNSGSNYTVTAETGAWFFRANNVRVVTSTANKVDTTTTATFSAGSNVTITVGSTARMYAGQRLVVNFGATSEGWTVVSVTNSTQMVIAVVGTTTGSTGHPVQAHVIYADEVVKDIRAAISTLNSAQLAASDTLMQSPSRDLLDEIYEDMYGADILDYLIKLGDSQATPRQWEWGVAAGRQLYFRPVSSAARTWYIDVSEIEAQRTLEALYNSVYATYREAGGRTLRTAAASDSASVARYGLTRRKQLSASSTSSTQATAQRDAALADSKDPKPRSGVTIGAVYDGNGTRWPLTEVRTGDTMIIRNLPPTLSTSVDKIRVFRITRTEYNAAEDMMTIEPEAPLPSLDAMLALAVPPSWVTAPWWVQIAQE